MQSTTIKYKVRSKDKLAYTVNIYRHGLGMTKTKITNQLPRIKPYHAYNIYSVDIQAGSDITDCIPIVSF